MDLLKNNDGFSMVEALVGIIILGIIMSFTIMVFNSIIENPKITFKGAAFLMADRELSYCENRIVRTDTIYTNETGNLELRRKVNSNGLLNNILISVILKQNEKEILFFELISKN